MSLPAVAGQRSRARCKTLRSWTLRKCPALRPALRSALLRELLGGVQRLAGCESLLRLARQQALHQRRRLRAHNLLQAVLNKNGACTHATYNTLNCLIRQQG